MTYRSSKTYGHEIGLSCCFRQWRADSHCKYLHGYALSFHFEFEADELDERNWVVDFGSLKSLRAALEENFDHKTIIAHDDPMKSHFLALDRAGLAQVIIFDNVGCEAFAEYAFERAALWLRDYGYAPRVRVHSVTVREHGANSATFTRAAE